jgi:lactate dehydrogenase-like 2-hydroxyacid dehydrogenase
MKSTHHLVDATFLAAMKPGSRIVNTARGAVIDVPALISALESGHLLSAGLDVHYNEPRVAPEWIAMASPPARLRHRFLAPADQLTTWDARSAT